MICACIMASNPSEAADLAARAAGLGAGAVEIRGDRFGSFPLCDLAKALRTPSVFTLRSPAAGGFFKGTEEERISLLLEASRSGFSYVDVERESGVPPARFSCNVILSLHDFSSCPPGLEALASGMAAAGAHAVKIAVTPSSCSDVVRIMRLQRRPPCRASVFGLGPMGFATRITGSATAFMTYASLEPGLGTAEYQPSVPDLTGKYSGASPGAEVYGVAGRPALHSLGPEVHNALFRSRGIRAVYVPFETDSLTPLARAAEELGIRGLSVTMPFKMEAAEIADRLTPAASEIGAVNTLTFEGGRIDGDNTDASAVVDAIESRTGAVAGLSVLVIGAGGAARAAVFGLSKAGARVTITNRTESRGRDLAARWGALFAALGTADPSAYDVLVQATPIGSGGDGGEAVPGRRARRGSVVLEMIYRPSVTAFMAGALEAGAEAIPGSEMFAHQAAAQFRIWTGAPAGAADVMRILRGKEEA